MELGSERHGVDHKQVLVHEFEQDELEEVASEVRSDGKDLGWVGIGLEVDEDKGIVKGVDDVGVCSAMTQRRLVDVHTVLS